MLTQIEVFLFINVCNICVTIWNTRVSAPRISDLSLATRSSLTLEKERAKTEGLSNPEKEAEIVDKTKLTNGELPTL